MYHLSIVIIIVLILLLLVWEWKARNTFLLVWVRQTGQFKFWCCDYTEIFIIASITIKILFVCLKMAWWHVVPRPNLIRKLTCRFVIKKRFFTSSLIIILSFHLLHCRTCLAKAAIYRNFRSFEWLNNWFIIFSRDWLTWLDFPWCCQAKIILTIFNCILLEIHWFILNQCSFCFLFLYNFHNFFWQTLLHQSCILRSSSNLSIFDCDWSL
jgi:hypothetical protein